MGPTAVIDVDGPVEIAGWRSDRPVGSDVAPVDRADSPLGPTASPVGRSRTPVDGELAVRDGWTDPEALPVDAGGAAADSLDGAVTVHVENETLPRCRSGCAKGTPDRYVPQ